MGITAVIPARGQSQGIENKNIQLLGGKPMVCWTVEAALKSKLSKVVLSTDCAKIRDACSSYRGLTIVDQPSPMKDGAVNAVHVVLWYLRTLNDNNIALPAGVCMLLPTSPLRTYKHINSGIDKFEKGNKVVISCCASKPLHSIRKITDERLVPVSEGTDLNSQRQDVTQLYQINGSIYIAQPDLLLRSGSFHVEEAVPLRMSARYSLDVNTPEDLEIVRKML